MAPKPKKKKGGTESSGVPKSKDDITEAPEEEVLPIDLGKTIKIYVNKLYNLKQPSPSTISVTVEHLNNVLDSTTVTLLGEDEITVDLQTELVCFTTDRQATDQMLTNPLIFTVTEILPPKDKRSKVPEENCLGKCNLDLKPLFIGETMIQEDLILEQIQEYLDMEMVTWPNLPRLSVCIIAEEPIFSPEELEDKNILCITVESLYNILPNMTEQYNYAAGCKWPADSGVLNDIILEGGKWSSSKSNTVYKHWPSTTEIEGKAANSKFRLDSNNIDIKTDLQIDLQAFIDADAPRIEWNELRRCLITKIAGHEIFDRLSRYNSWPVEIKISQGEKGSPKKKGNKNPREKESAGKKGSEKTAATKDKKGKDSSQSDHFWVRFDVTDLLYPGVKSTRAAAQLFTFSQTEMTKLTGILEPVFSEVPPEVSPKQKPDKKKPDKSPKGSPKSAKTQPNTDAAAEVTLPLVNAMGDPVFMVIQVEFLKPLHPKRLIALIEQRLLRLIPPTGSIHKKLMTAELAHEHYQATILTLSEEISKAYRRYNMLSANIHCLNAAENDFITFLHRGGVYQHLKETLQNKIIVLIRERCIDGHELNDRDDLQNHIQNMYIYLTEEMHSVINAQLEGAPYPRQHPFHFSLEKLLLFALEAQEEGHLTTAQEFYLKRIATDRKDPEPWIDYAVYCVRRKDLDKAEECVKEALSLDIRNRMGLLMYGIFRTQKGDYHIAEMVFEALTCFHATFVEGWVAFHLFYLKTENCPGAHVTLSAARKCFAEFESDKCRRHERFYQWDSSLYSNDSIFLLATITLLKINAFEFVEMALAQQLVNHGISAPYYYYLSVNHYFQERYQDALDHLTSAATEFSMDCCLACLMGHCHFKMKNKEKAMQYYRFGFESYNRPSNVHLSGLRLGTIYLEKCMFEDAKYVYNDITSCSPSPLSWLGLGLTFYLMQEYEEAETALCEANILDNRNSTIWAYLTLINLHFQRQAEFEICYRQLVKLRSVDEDLMHHIIKKQQELRYPEPTPLLHNLCTWM